MLRKRNGLSGALPLMWLVGSAILALSLLVLQAAEAAPKAGEAVTINGAGGSFPYPLYARWGDNYSRSILKEKGSIRFGLNYRLIGSDGGIAQIKAKTVDFGASDVPLKPEDLDKEGLTQFPMVIGGVVPIINISNLGKKRLKLTPELLSEIFLGSITKWNDSRIVAR